MKKTFIYGALWTLLVGNSVAYAEFMLESQSQPTYCAAVHDSNTKLVRLHLCDYDDPLLTAQLWQTVSFPQLSNTSYIDPKEGGPYCLEGGSLGKGLYLKPCQGGPKQDWLFDGNMIRNAAAHGRCMVELGGQVQVQKCDVNAPGQQWKIVSVGAPDLRTHLIAAYLFYKNAKDVSGNGHIGQVNGASLTKDRFGIPNSAYLFDGKSSNIEVEDAEVLRLSDRSFTVSAWIYETKRNVDNAAVILSKRGKGNEDGWLFSTTGTKNGKPGRLHTIFSKGNDPRIRTTSEVVLQKKWYHVALTFKKYAQIPAKIYVDGELRESNPNNLRRRPNPNTQNNMFIGQDSAHLYNGYYFNGKLDDIQIYNKALSESEIKALSNIR
jgi:hypothetical protein